MNTLPAKSSINSLMKKAGAVAKANAPRARIVFALDATASREPTWQMAKQLQAQMLQEAARIGTLDVSLAFFRGLDDTNFSEFTSSADHLVDLMNQIRCEMGTTQIGTILHHSLKLHNESPIAAIVFIGDTYEENGIGGAAEFSASQLKAAGVPLFVFHEGKVCEGKLRNLADLSGGAYASFREGSASELAELLKSIAAFATGGLKALEAKANSGSSSARLLLTQLK
jgi:hypothetical protein